MKNKIILLATIWLLTGGSVLAEKMPPTLPATNLDTPYPSINTLFPEPVPPAGNIHNFNGLLLYLKYADEVFAYNETEQKYLDGVYNDANDIIDKSYEAAEKAQEVLEQYNSFFDEEKET